MGRAKKLKPKKSPLAKAIKGKRIKTTIFDENFDEKIMLPRGHFKTTYADIEVMHKQLMELMGAIDEKPTCPAPAKLLCPGGLEVSFKSYQ